MPATPAVPLDIADLTNSTKDTQGTGIFDILIAAVERQIGEQHELGRLAGTDYATVYLGSMQSVLAESVKIFLSQDLTAQQVATETEKTNLVNAQALGFASDTKQKVLKQMVEGHSIYLSLAGTGNMPESFRENSIDQLTQELISDVLGDTQVQSQPNDPAWGDSPSSTQAEFEAETPQGGVPEA